MALVGTDAEALNKEQTTNFGGQQVLVGDQIKKNLESSAAVYNKSQGTNLSAEQYDRLINPTTAGARWGDANPITPTTPGNTSGGGTAGGIAYTGYAPSAWSVGKEQTVEGRIAGLTDPNSQLNQAAQARAQQAAASRGLINSSIAATAGQQAILNTALPIAQQDASTFAQSGQFNAASENQAKQFGAGAANTASLQGASSANQLAIAGLNAETQKYVAGLNKQSQETIANLDAKTKTDLQNIVSKNSQVLQSNTSAANLVAQYLSSVSSIQTSKDLDAGAKQTAISNQISALQEGLRTLGGISGLDLSQYFQQLKNENPASIPAVNPEEFQYR